MSEHSTAVLGPLSRSTPLALPRGTQHAPPGPSMFLSFFFQTALWQSSSARSFSEAKIRTAPRRILFLLIRAICIVALWHSIQRATAASLGGDDALTHHAGNRGVGQSVTIPLETVQQLSDQVDPDEEDNEPLVTHNPPSTSLVRSSNGSTARGDDLSSTETTTDNVVESGGAQTSSNASVGSDNTPGVDDILIEALAQLLQGPEYTSDPDEATDLHDGFAPSDDIQQKPKMVTIHTEALGMSGHDEEPKDDASTSDDPEAARPSMTASPVMPVSQLLREPTPRTPVGSGIWPDVGDSMREQWIESLLAAVASTLKMLADQVVVYAQQKQPPVTNNHRLPECENCPLRTLLVAYKYPHLAVGSENHDDWQAALLGLISGSSSKPIPLHDDEPLLDALGASGGNISTGVDSAGLPRGSRAAPAQTPIERLLELLGFAPVTALKTAEAIRPSVIKLLQTMALLTAPGVSVVSEALSSFIDTTGQSIRLLQRNLVVSGFQENIRLQNWRGLPPSESAQSTIFGFDVIDGRRVLKHSGTPEDPKPSSSSYPYSRSNKLRYLSEQGTLNRLNPSTSTVASLQEQLADLILNNLFSNSDSPTGRILTAPEASGDTPISSSNPTPLVDSGTETSLDSDSSTPGAVLVAWPPSLVAVPSIPASCSTRTAPGVRVDATTTSNDIFAAGEPTSETAGSEEFQFVYLNQLHMEFVTVPDGCEVEAFLAELKEDPNVAAVFRDHMVDLGILGPAAAEDTNKDTVTSTTTEAASRYLAASASANAASANHSAEAVIPEDAKHWSRDVNWSFLETSTPHTSDPHLKKQWSLDNEQQHFGGANVLTAWSAWANLVGSPQWDHPVVVALLDSGIDVTHYDLHERYWHNDGEICNNHIDDDRNGYVDDCNGWDFIEGDPFPQDATGHGTAAAGVMASIPNNRLGIAPVCLNCVLMNLRVLNEHNRGPISGFVRAIDYALGKGVRISNNSYGGRGEGYEMLYEAVARARNAGMVFVAAAGNFAHSNDLADLGLLPGSYPLDNIISVASVTKTGRLATYSNFGKSTVHLGAPGDQIYTTIPHQGYLEMSGTSFAAPHVTGLVAMIWQAFPYYSYQQVIQRVLQGARQLPALQNITISGATLDAFNSLSLPEEYFQKMDTHQSGSESGSNIRGTAQPPKQCGFLQVLLRRDGC